MEERLVKKTTESDVRWCKAERKTSNGMGGSVKRALGARRMSVEQGRAVVRDRNE